MVLDIFPEDIKEVDIIITGARTAACVIARRLTNADPNFSILVVERGPTSFDIPTVSVPALFVAGLAPTSKVTLFYQGVEEPQLGGQACIIRSGGTLGGGSSINALVYSRAQLHDYDDWQTEGWSTQDILPYLKKLETYHGPDPTDNHGSTGPINVSGGTWRAERSTQDFIDAAETLGYPSLEDGQIFKDNIGPSPARRYVGTDGIRQDTATRHLRPRLESDKHPNLYVVLNSQVKRILFEGKRACGIEYVPGSNTDAESLPRKVRAKKLVIVSAGALGTPLILERSGVGDPKILKAAGVPVITELPGVGANYQDHDLMMYSYYTNLEERETVDLLAYRKDEVGRIIKEKDPILGWNAIDIQAKIRPTEKEVSQLGSAFRKAWERDFKKDKTRPTAIINTVNNLAGAGRALVPQGQYYTMTIFSCYPYSRGSIHISGSEIIDKPIFKTGFLSDPEGVDLKTQVWMNKTQRKIARRMKLYRGEVHHSHPKFASSSAATLAESPKGRLEEVSDIVYTAEDDKAIEDWARKNVGTTWHSMGTAKMAPLEEGGVVDADLNVHGLENLKIADLSIPPLHVAANTNNTAIAIGEKAADIIIKVLGL